jgi:S-DNA-T family DNA segregation ATPase FtsK/SpoIIIE
MPPHANYWLHINTFPPILDPQSQFLPRRIRAMASPARSALANDSDLSAPALRRLLQGRLGQLAGLALAFLALTLLFAVLTYNARDPSLNTAGPGSVSNFAGPAGAAAADILVQGFGIASLLPSLVLLAWAWRLSAHRGLGSVSLRAVALLAGLFMLAALATLLPLPPRLGYPGPAGPGGAAGQLIADTLWRLGQGTFGAIGVGIAFASLGLLTLLLLILAFGLSFGEWRAVGRTAVQATRYSAAGTRRAVDGIGRGRAVASRWGSLLPWRRGRTRLAEDIARPTPPADLPFHTGADAEPLPRWAAPEPDSAPAPKLAVPEAAPPAAPPRSRRGGPRQQEALPLGGGWRMPPLALLRPAPARSANAISDEMLVNNSRLLETVLEDYGVQGRIVGYKAGPVVTLYELEPAPGIRSARVIGLADDIARSLSVTAVRIATVPGRNVIGIEVPNSRRETVFLSELLGSDAVRNSQGRLTLALGKNIAGAPVIADLATMPHLMIAGTTGSGKSVGVNAMILSLLYRLSPDQCRLIMIDPKMLELSVYEGIPHLLAPVVTDPSKAVVALKWTVREMERRYRAMTHLAVRNIAGYNARVSEARAKGEVITRRVQTGFDPDTGKPVFEEQPLALEPLPLIVVVVDEMADLMMVAGKEIEAAVQRLAQMARAAGIHVIMATQRPSVDVITGTIKANFPTRISFQVISKFDSRTILGEQGAEQLLGQGDMLYMMGGGRITRVHGPFVSDQEVEEVVRFLRAQGEPAYVDEVTEPEDEDGAMPLPGFAEGNGEKGLYEQAVALVSREGRASTSFLQRHLNLGYNRAAKLIEQMEKDGIVGPANHVGKREVLVGGREVD